MTYRVVVTMPAEADIREQLRYLRGLGKPAVADKWIVGLNKAFLLLSRRPLSCPLAAESDKFPRPIRELLHGSRRDNRFRILFEVQEDVVLVLFVRHAARDQVEP
jgi:plasmid stabilization system protein ParE